MTVDEIFSDLDEAGIQLWLDADRLRFRAPVTAMTDTVRAAIRTNRSAIVSRLQQALRAASEHQARCGGCDRRDWIDAPTQQGWIRTTCRRCGTFIGYRPGSFSKGGPRT